MIETAPPPVQHLRWREVLRRQFWWFATTVVAVFSFSTYFTMRQQAVFGSRVTLRLEEDRGRAGAADLLSPLATQSSIPTEMELLRSRTLAEFVVDSLALHVQLIEPSQRRLRDVLRHVTAGRDAARGEYRIRRGPDGVTAFGPTGRQVRAPYDALVQFEDVAFSVPRPALGDTGLIRLTVASFDAAAEQLRQGLRVTRPQQTASIVAVEFESTDPALARDVVNGIAGAYIAQRNAGERRQATATVQFLGAQVLTISNQLDKAETALADFRRSRLMVDPPAQASAEVQRMAALRLQGDEMGADRSALMELMRLLGQPRDSAATWTVFAASPVVIRNPAMSALISQLSSLESERSKLAGWRTSADPDVVTLDRTIALLNLRLVALVREQLSNMVRVSAVHDSAVVRSGEQLREVPQSELEYSRLRRQVDLTSELFALLQTRLKEAQVSEAVELANVRLVDPAILAAVPIRPRRIQSLIFGLAGALFLGLVAVVLRELSATRVQTREDVIDLTTLPVLASIPRMNPSKRARSIDVDAGQRMITQRAPLSAAAEAYRGLRTNLAYSIRSERDTTRIIVVTSAEPQDGKTTTAVNLAATFAEQGHRVLLIEADHRRPMLHRVFGVVRSPGLSEVLAGATTLDTAVRGVPLAPHTMGTLSVLTCGASVPNPSELIGSPAMRELITLASAQYDYVLLDTPPLSVVTDAAVAGRLADSVLMVARLGETHRQSLQRALEELRELGLPVRGLVLTDLRTDEDRYGQRYVNYYYADARQDGALGA